MAKGVKIDGLVFDLTRIGMDDLEDFVAGLNASEFRKVAATMARCCVKCPEEWGAPGEAATFFKRPPVGEWRWKDVVDHFWATLNTSGE